MCAYMIVELLAGYAAGWIWRWLAGCVAGWLGVWVDSWMCRSLICWLDVPLVFGWMGGGLAG